MPDAAAIHESSTDPRPPDGTRTSPARRPNLLARIEALPGAGVLVRAVHNYIVHQSANQAGSVAFSTVLAMFPLLLLLATAAGYLGSPGDAAAMVERVIGYAPPVVRDALQPVVGELLGHRRQALLAVGLLVTLWTGSSGLQAIRTALNRAYGVERGLSFLMARLKVTLFTVIAGLGTVVAFSTVVVMPYVWMLLRQAEAAGADPLWLRTGVRYGSAFVVVTLVYALLYGWLPDTRQRLRTVLPGAAIGALLWVGAAALLSYTLRSAGKMALIYGGFAGVVATLVFLYISAVTLIYGAEVNAVLGERR